MSMLSSRLEDYLAMRRGIGFKLSSDGTALISFVGFMELNNATYITNELVKLHAFTAMSQQRENVKLF